MSGLLAGTGVEITIEPEGRWQPPADDVAAFLAARGAMMTSAYMRMRGRAAA